VPGDTASSPTAPPRFSTPMSRTKPSLILLLALAGMAAAAGERPNIVYFFADDLGWAGVKPNQAIAAAEGTDMSELGKVLTPHIDSIVDGGINFTRAYGNPVCSPSRSCQQTGFHQGHTWTDRNDPDASKAMRTMDPTMGRLLAAAGYRNGMYGKWGYGTSANRSNPVVNHEQTLPIHHGYHDVLVENNHLRAHSYQLESLWRSFVDDDGTVVTDTTLVDNDSLYPELRYNTGFYFIDDLYATAARDFISAELAKQKAAAELRPFFAQVSFQVPHSDDNGSPSAFDEVTSVDGWYDDYTDAGVDDSSWDNGMRYYAAMLTHMDRHIGAILDLLADPDGDPGTDDSVLEDTLIIFASDNGGASNSAPANFNINGHLARNKGHVFEGGIRVPLAFRWDGTIAPGRSSNRRVCITDMLPTFCELAGVEEPVGLDGVSFAPLLTGEGSLRERRWLAYEDHNNGAFDWALIKDDYKLIQESGGALRLYQLDDDEDESQNRADWAAEQQRVAEMLGIARAEGLDEGDDFANTWPTWTGGDGADVNAPSSWTEDNPWSFPDRWTYGETPRAHWNAVVANPDAANRGAVLGDSIRTLGFEVSGNPGTGHTQTVTLGSGVSLEGRNEIRVGDHGVLELDGGTLSSARWLAIRPEGALRGAGTIAADLENEGTLDITRASDRPVPGDGAEVIANGGFELGTADGSGDYTYSGIDAWTTTPAGDPSADAAKPNDPHGGSFRGLVHGTPSEQENLALVQDTGIPILDGDRYTLSFHAKGKGNWEGGSDRIRIRVFYEGASDPVDLLSTTVPGNDAWTFSSLPIGPVTDPGALGRSIQVLFVPDQDAENGSTEWASLDDVSLTRDSAPSSLPGARELGIGGDLRAFPHSTLGLRLGPTDHSRLVVSGHASLAGSLAISLDPGFTPDHGDSFVVLTAASRDGSFGHPDDRALADTGQPFKISYAPTAVTLTAIGITSSGVPYDWLEERGLVSPGSGDAAYEAAALADADRDGCKAADEYVAGTDPNEAASVFRVAGVSSAGGSLTLEWGSVAGREYSVLAAEGLSAPFTHYSGPHPATPPTNRLAIPIAGIRRFFRVSASLVE